MSEFQTLLPEEYVEDNSEDSKEARFSGLPTQNDVNQSLRHINGSLRIENQNKNSIDPAFTFPKYPKPETISRETYLEYIKEFKEDVEDFHLRIQRLKIRALTYYAAGNAANLEKIEENDPNYDKTFGAKLTKLTGDYKYREKPFDSQAQQELIFELNKRLPKKYPLAYLQNLSSDDVEQLYNASFALRFGKPPIGQQRKMLESILDQINAIEAQLAETKTQGELFSADENKFVSEKKFALLWDEYRQLLKQIAASEELNSWYSPTFGASGKGQRGENQASEPFRTDYQRFKMDEIVALESRLNRTYFKKNRYQDYVKSLLFNGGLNGLTAILELIDNDLARQKKARIPRAEKKESAKKSVSLPTIFKTKNIYFEVDALITNHYSGLEITPQEFDAADIDALTARIKSDLPAAVFLNPMSNMYGMEITEITKLLEALTDEKWKTKALKKLNSEGERLGSVRPIFIVIDNSTLGRLASWKDFNFARLPEFVKIISFESLVKYAQDGQDLAQAGLVTTIGEYLDSSLSEVRSRLGFMPPENTVRKLEAFVPADLTDKKMIRHSRNAKFIAAALEKDASTADSFIAEIIYPHLPSHPQQNAAESETTGGGALFGIGFDFEFLKTYQEKHDGGKDYFGNNQYYLENKVSKYDFRKTAGMVLQAFNNLVTAMAKEAGIDINQGTSYGFQTTRLAVYNRILPKEKEMEYLYQDVPYIRCAVGTENIKDTVIITEIIKRAGQIFEQAKKEQRILRLSSCINSHEKKFNFE